LIDSKDTSKCEGLMCGHLCTPKFSPECSLTLLDRKILCPEIHQYAIKVLDTIEQDELECYISYLVENAIQSPFTIISDWLIQKSKNDLKVATRVFWYIQNGLKTNISTIATKYNAMLISWKNEVCSNIQQDIKNGHKFVQTIRKHYNSSNDEIKYDETVTLPTDSHIKNLHVVVKDVDWLKSKTKPMKIPLADSSGEVKKILLYKKEDIRKDQIIMDIIRLMDIFLKRNGININIITYNIQPTGPYEGLIEIVQNSKTLYEIQGKEKLIHNIIYKRHDASDRLNRFIESCAFCAVMTLLLGIGDRHLENIMISSEGILFHIDFGYILGRDPKLISTANIRITFEMSDALGNINSDVYKDFDELSGKIFNCLRQYVTTFTCMLNLFAYIQPEVKPKFTQEEILKEIIKRFVPGANQQQAKIQISNRIDNSTTNTFQYQVIDFFHKQMDLDEGFIRHLNSVGSNILSGIWGLMPAYTSNNKK
jgi:phosphatidylinositol 3-kinase